MQCTHCDFCGQPIEQIDFYLALKGGNICPACLLLSQAQDAGPDPILDNRQPEETPSRPEMPVMDKMSQRAVLF